ncbi:MAG: hypothetical protein ACLUFF_00310 [Acutalibacteraceae bacterium]
MWLLLYRAQRKAKALNGKTADDHGGKTAANADGTGPHSGWNNVKTLLWLRFAARTKRTAAKEQTSISAVRSKDTKRRKAAQKAPGAFLYDKTKNADWCLF